MLAEHSARISFEERGGREGTIGIYRNTLRLWDVVEGKCVAQLGPSVEGRGAYQLRLLKDYGPDCRVRISPIGTVLSFPRYPKTAVLQARRDDKGSLYLDEWLTGKELFRFREFEEGSLTGYALSPGHGVLSASGKLRRGGSTQDLVFWDVSSLRDRVLRAKLDLPAAELPALWEKLGDKDPLAAHRAMRRLAAAPEQSLPFVKERLRPVPSHKDKINPLIPQLEDQQFEVRKHAQQALLQLGEQAAIAIQNALQANPSVDARRTMESILKTLKEEQQADAQTRRLLWSIELLEEWATPAARQLLETLAQGAPESWITRESKASLERLIK